MNRPAQLSRPRRTEVTQLIDQYSVLLLDVYGVLRDEAGPLPGARELINHLNCIEKPYYLITNSASRLPETLAHELAKIGLPIPVFRIITSGVVLRNYFRENDLRGQLCIVLGTEESKQYVRIAGGQVVNPDPYASAGAVIIADQAGFPVWKTLDDTMTVILRRLDAEKPIRLLLCNPDLIYPRASQVFGLTAGAVAAMIEAVLSERYPGCAESFVRLGKPFLPIFEEAARRSGTRDMVMIGDQLATDILGARRADMDSALLETGVARIAHSPAAAPLLPTYQLSSLRMQG